MHDTQEPLREHALLIGLERPGHDKWAVKDSLDELRELAVSAGAEVLDIISQKRDNPAAPPSLVPAKPKNSPRAAATPARTS